MLWHNPCTWQAAGILVPKANVWILSSLIKLAFYQINKKYAIIRPKATTKLRINFMVNSQAKHIYQFLSFEGDRSQYKKFLKLKKQTS